MSIDEARGRGVERGDRRGAPFSDAVAELDVVEVTAGAWMVRRWP